MTEHDWEYTPDDSCPYDSGEEAPLGDSYDDARWDLSQAAGAESDAAWYASEAADDLDNAGS
jgi:hypothetical protein